MEEAQQKKSEESAVKRKFKRICVFCGSRAGNKPSFSHAALELGKLLVRNSNIKDKLIQLLLLFAFCLVSLRALLHFAKAKLIHVRK